MHVTVRADRLVLTPENALENDTLARWQGQGVSAEVEGKVYGSAILPWLESGESYHRATIRFQEEAPAPESCPPPPDHDWITRLHLVYEHCGRKPVAPHMVSVRATDLRMLMDRYHSLERREASR